MVAMATVPTEIRSADTGLGRVVQPFNDRTTWGGALHLLLGLPLGVAYFAFYVAGLATSAALSLLIVGLPLLLAMLATIRPLVLFEARMARALTGVDVAEPAPAARRLGALLRDDATWRRLAYLLSRFPIGIVSFALAAVIIVLPLGLLASPILYSTAPLDLGVWRIDSLPEALAATVLGLLLVFRATCMLRILGRISGLYARLMLR